MTVQGLVCLLSLSLHGPGNGRDTIPSVAPSAPIEKEPPGSDRYFEGVQSESDNLPLLDDLLWRQEHPYDLNSITEAELESIPGVTPHEAAAFIRFRKSRGRFTDVSQLKDMDEAGDDLYEKAAPYVTVSPGVPVVQLRSRESRDVQPRRGSMDNIFLGSSLKSYGRLSVEAADFEMGAVAEKDAGERLANGFVSGYVAATNMGPLSQVVLGDFSVESGQGLVFWRGASFGKGSEAVAVVKKSGAGVRPCRSTDEFNYFRGLAVSTSLGILGGRLNVSGFFSQRGLDGSVDSLHQVTSFYDAGLFQTLNDLDKRDAVIERLAGGRVELVNDGGWQIGSTVYHETFNKRIVPDRVHELAGRTGDVLGLDAAVNGRNVSAFGEIARSGDRAVAGVVGTIIHAGVRSNVVLLYRDYGVAFNNLHAGGFGEHSQAKNERGFYIGTDIRVLKWLRFSGFLDQFKFPWRTYVDPLPTVGHEILLQADAALSRGLDLSARFVSRSAEGAESDQDGFGREIRSIVDRGQQKYRLAVSYEVTPRWRVRGRFEFTEVGYGRLKGPERGYLLFEDLRYGVPGLLSVEGRLVFFQTDSYDSRLYEYESDLRGVFSNPGLYGKGRRWYVVLRYIAANTLTLSAKYSELQKEGVTSLGSGPDEIPGCVSDHVALQVDLRL